MSSVSCYIEIEKNSNLKYEFDKEQQKLVLDRVLVAPYYYPFAYGFIPNTLGNDGDDLDILVITDKEVHIDTMIKGYIIGALVMEDEHGMDEKVFIVPEDEYINLTDVEQMDSRVIHKIVSFFSNYKNKDKDKWSKVHGIMSKVDAIKLYEKCRIN
jgi:inorganic pyrophosphatase